MSGLGPSKKRSSVIWDYFVVRDEFLECTLCDPPKQLTDVGNTTNMWSHLKNHHPTHHDKAKAKQHGLHIQPPITTHFTPLQLPAGRVDAINRSLLKFIIGDLQPLSRVESDAFREFCHSLHKGFTPPTVHTLKKLLFAQEQKLDELV